MSTLVATNGDETSADEPMYVHIYPDSSTEDDECEDYIGDHLGQVCGELYNVNAVDFYEVIIRYDHPKLDPGTWDTASVYDAWETWLTGAGYDDELGAHLHVADEYWGGGAEKVDGSGETAFSKSKPCVVGTDVNKDLKYTNAAIQETMHTFLWYDVLVEFDLVKSGDSVHEHDLGQTYNDHSVSPMATTYEGEHTQHGQCDNSPGFWGLYTPELTSCAEEGVEVTADFDT